MQMEEVQKLAAILYLILLIIVALNFFAFLAYFLQEKQKNSFTRQMLSYWGVQVLILVAAPFFQGSNLLMCVPFSANVLTVYFLRKGALGDFGEIPPYKNYVYLLAAAFGVSVTLEYFFGSFLLTALPLAFAVSAPMLEIVLLVFFDKRKRFTTIHHKWMAAGFMAAIVHNFNFAFFGNEPSAIVWGSTVHILMVTMFGIVISNFHNFILHRGEKERLEKLVDERTKELNENLQTVNHLKDKNENLFKVVLHDISNPMSAVIGYLTLLEKLGDNLKEEMKEKYLKGSIASAESVAGTIRQVRALASSETGAELFLEEVSLTEAFEMITTVFEPLYEKKGVELDVKLPDKGVAIKGNKDLFIHSVMGNLLSNSLKFSEPGSKVCLWSERSGSKIKILVKDCGTGIKSEKIEKIFEFKNCGSTEGTAGEKGNGFGLPILANYLKNHGGDISIQSKHVSEHSKEHGTQISIIMDTI